ncbi:viral protein [Cherax quadricarinatus densovirus]|uniref:Viral protein n=1 Tax=Cherax quadricarinatus densovirus TaxID=1642018 RepID=A0A0E3XUQ8_9VIRU|nr:viral protein [Cherax quadricarinatus densovirus]AKC42762.1 viral protein [Cherax quadricarinatus densovirus]
MAEEAFELIRRTGGSRIQYSVRTAGGLFKTVPNYTYSQAVGLAERNIPIDIREGAVNLNEYINFEHNFSQLNSGEQIPLDNIELNTTELSSSVEEGLSLGTTASETTPLLSSTGGVGAAAAGTGSAVASGGSTALAVGGGLIGSAIIGGLIGGLTTKSTDSVEEPNHIDPVVSLPDHHYIGPGNTLSGIKPVDTDDHIALDHDKAYEQAKTQQDIQNADKKSAGEFLTDIIENSNPHSIAGYIGLKAKETVEGLVGVKYPANLPISSDPGMGREIRALNKYPIHRDPSRHDDFPSSKSQQRYVWDAWNRARQNHGLPRVDPPPRLGLGVTFRPPTNPRTGLRQPSTSISYRQWKDTRKSGSSGPLFDVLSKSVADDLTPDEQSEITDILSQIEGGSISIADFDNRDGAGPSSAADPSPGLPDDDIEMVSTRGQKRPNEDEQGGSVAPADRPEAAPAAPAQGTGHNSSSDGGFDSAQGPISFLPTGGYEVKSGYMVFKKVHRMKSWAIPYWNIAASTVRSGANIVTTPLAKIPWEYAFFYMSPEEFLLLPAGSFMDSCLINVTQTVASTGYPIGGTEASTATTNHPKVLCIGKDLEKTMRGGIDRGLDFSDNMIPSLKADANSSVIYDDFIAKQYGTDQTAADNAIVVPGVGHKIPFYNQNHFCVYQPNRAQAKAKGFFTENTATPPVITSDSSPGFEYFQNYIRECNANDTTWNHVDTMKYKFNYAPIGQQFKQLEIVTDSFNQSVGNAQYYNAKRTVTGTTVGGNTAIAESFVPSNRNSLPIVTYKSAPMEKGSYYVRGDSAGKPSRQPSYHIGMRAIDKASPADNDSRASKFVHANIEFEIEAVLVVRLPSYPNRFIRPKFYNTSLENAAMGIGTYPAFGPEKFVTFGLLNDSATAPAVNPIDQVGDEPTEDDMVCVPSRQRPRRSLPEVSTRVLRKKSVLV